MEGDSFSTSTRQAINAAATPTSALVEHSTLPVAPLQSCSTFLTTCENRQSIFMSSNEPDSKYCDGGTWVVVDECSTDDQEAKTIYKCEY